MFPCKITHNTVKEVERERWCTYEAAKKKYLPTFILVGKNVRNLLRSFSEPLLKDDKGWLTMAGVLRDAFYDIGAVRPEKCWKTNQTI